MMCRRIEYPLARPGSTINPLLQLLVAVLVLSSRDNKGSYELISRNLLTNAAANAIVVGGVLLPHGDFALDPSFFPNGTQEREAADRVARGARRAGRWLVELQQQQRQQHRFKEETNYGDSYVAEEEPMIVLMTTPHGIKLDHDYGIYISSKGSGTATIGGDCTGSKDSVGHIGIGRLRNHRGLPQEMPTATKDGRHHCQHKPYNVTINNMDLAPTSLAKDLLSVLRHDKGHPVSGVYSYNDETPIPLNWGEIVPLLLLPTTFASATSSSISSSKNPQQLLPLIWTFPYRRYNHSVDMVPELLQVGADIMEWAQQRTERIAILVSGDLSHTHQSSGPYGYSDASAPYDAAIGLWAGGQTNGTTADVRGSWDPCHPEATNALLHRAKELQPDAKSCGFTGYVMWHGMMCSSSPTAPLLKTRDDSEKTDNGRKSGSDMEITQRNDRRVKFDSKVFVNRNVTYYGMIGATFEPYLAGEESNDDVGNRIDFNDGKEQN